LSNIAKYNTIQKAIREMTPGPPNTTRRIKEFLGWTNYFRSMVPNFSTKAELTKKTSDWSGGRLPPKAYEAFKEIQEKLV
jgi:hypothetical protein